MPCALFLEAAIFSVIIFFVSHLLFWWVHCKDEKELNTLPCFIFSGYMTFIIWLGILALTHSVGFYFDTGKINTTYVGITFGLVLVGVSSYLLYNSQISETTTKCLLIAWALLPPIWFMVEFSIVYDAFSLR